MSLTSAQRETYRFFAVEQTISAGNNFDGTAPAAGTWDDDTLTLRHAAAAAGGLFDPGWSAPAGADATINLRSTNPVVVAGVELELGLQSSWRIDILSGGSAPDVVWKSGTTEDDVVLYGEDQELILWPGQTLKLVTAGASAVMTARVKFRSAVGQAT